MESVQKCSDCKGSMSYIGNDPPPVKLGCFHIACLTCVNKKTGWSP